MWSRWDMQEHPPDVLITNYQMLNVMLMRSIEAGIFDKTKAWLESSEDHCFFLVVDELHTYRGTPGTEVAYLLRLLLERLGLTLDSPKLRIIATTASLDDDEKGRRFLEQFFGRDRFTFISGSQEAPPEGMRSRAARFEADLARFATAVQPDVLAQAPVPERAAEAAGILAGALGGGGADPWVALGDALQAQGLGDAVRDACLALSGDGRIRAARIEALDEALFPRAPRPGVHPSDAMRGLLLGLGMSRTSDGRCPLPLRGHLFFHNLQNLWVCSNPGCSEHGMAQDEGPLAAPVGALHSMHRMTCGCGSRILDFIVCETCGDVLLGGFRRERMVGTQKVVTLPQSPSWTSKGGKRGWVAARLHHATGVLRTNASPPSADEVPGWLYEVSGRDTADEPAMPSRCPRCDTDFALRERATPLRNHRTGIQRSCQGSGRRCLGPEAVLRGPLLRRRRTRSTT